ncbi:hypothetical protein KKH3_32520 [Pectobacterium actinidiae]|nr:hypothetical protein KKH3_32520 [Pectobacterium actinidiae]
MKCVWHGHAFGALFCLKYPHLGSRQGEYCLPLLDTVESKQKLWDD